jgi:hypothetical protein
MDNTVKTLIIVVVILVAVLGVVGGFILQGYLSNTNKNLTVVNLTNGSVNNTSVNQTTQQKTQSNQNNKMISAAQAKAIANKYESDYNLEASGYVGFFDVGDGNPYYHVDLKYKNASSSDNQEVAYVTIYAKTGAIRS